MSARFAWERAVKASDMPPTRKLILLALATHSNKGGRAWPGHALLADECGLSERSIRKHLAAASADGWLECTRRGRNVGRTAGASVTSEYVLRVPATGTCEPVADDIATGTGVPGANLQPEPGDLQPEPERVATGTGVPPINKGSIRESIPHADLQRDSDPFESASSGGEEGSDRNPSGSGPRGSVPSLQQYEQAQRLGKRAAQLVDTEAAVVELFEQDRHLRNFPDVLRTVVNNWHRERVRLHIEPPEQMIR